MKEWRTKKKLNNKSGEDENFVWRQKDRNNKNGKRKSLLMSTSLTSYTDMYSYKTAYPSRLAFVLLSIMRIFSSLFIRIIWDM